MASKPKAPPPRSYGQETREAMYTQAGLIPEMIDLESYWLPKLQEHQYLGLKGQINNINRAYEEALPGMARNAAAYNEAMSPLMGDIARSSRESYMSGLGGGAQLLNTMTEQAQAGLARGREIDPQELEYAQQMARAGAASRGLGTSVQGIAGELLNTNTLRTQREAMNRQYATQVLGLNQGVLNAGYQAFGQPLVANAMGISPLQLMGLGRQDLQNLGPNYLQPESGYNAALIGQNKNLAWQASAAQAAAKNALTGAAIGATGQIVGAYAGAPTG